jgi:hypothetical protein
MVWQDEARTFATRDLSGTDYGRNTICFAATL